MTSPVIPLVFEGDVWVALISPVSSSSDVEVVELDGLACVEGMVRVGGSVMRLPVYSDDAGGAWVTWDDAFRA